MLKSKYALALYSLTWTVPRLQLCSR